jgi:hypothetical protein
MLALSACGADDTTTALPSTTAVPADSSTVPASGDELTHELDSRLGEDWETGVLDALDQATSQVEVDALLVGTWWAVADYCVLSTSKGSGECHDLAAAYLMGRLSRDPQFESSHFGGAGAVGAVMIDGYDGTAPYLDLPMATGPFGQGRPGF